MRRRSFLAALAGAFALDPERALWTPGAKTISIPKPRPMMETRLMALFRADLDYQRVYNRLLSTMLENTRFQLSHRA